MDDLETTWGLDDVERANAVLDYRETVDAALMPEEPKKGSYGNHGS